MSRSKPLSKDVYSNVYEASVIGKLEAYVNQQLKENTFDLEANLHLLKLYGIHSHKSNISIVRKIMLKSLMNVKDNAFSLAMYLLPGKSEEDQSIATLIQLDRLLEVAQYDEFWKAIDAHHEILQPASGFNQAIRDFIFDILLITYRTVEVEFLAEALHLEDTDLKTYLQTKGLRAEGKHITFPENEFTNLKQRAAPQNIQFEQIAKIF
eukprot:NODE_4772_length_742_cov_135.473171_g4610_i0.p1 GENE.NODE_4772_length_742_cov_135.473171_g4610_i0~~NODE_4772_length_742_cov_135.473171_g4610_i0.p1  ORF type:complete len:209 (+),score=63.27 NODE_4772_length_742_cov_135.473171_g4610_i0:71-697(+)